jgi:predicted negative regulator of RcsB-dependent stress response
VNDIRTDDEQLEALKNWWNENGKQIVTTVVIVAAGYFGWTFWQDQRTDHINGGSQVYTQLLQAAEQAEVGGVALDEELQTVRYLADQLANEFGDTQYAILGALVAARTAVEADDLEEAATRLQWALDNADNDAASQLASYRLARIRVAQGELDAAFVLIANPTSEYTSLYADLRGDILLQQGDKEGAVAAYQQALDSLLPGQEHYVSTLELKIDNLSIGLGSL